MSLSLTTLGRSMAVATITAGAVMIGASTSTAAPALVQPQQPTAATQVTTISDKTTHTVAATLGTGHFVADEATHSIKVTDNSGKTLESIPLTVNGAAAPVSATVGNDGKTLNLKQISFTDTGNQLINQWVWGVQHGGAVGAILGCLIGLFFFVLPGCAIGAAIGGAIGSPNSGQINATFFRLVQGG
ncbi:MAG: hypothetical protein J2P18_13500 [Nocardia sp.]|nr:hypothetical protein [Nocardia sp.]